jgi:RND family efflux transporter MFP subunit
VLLAGPLLLACPGDLEEPRPVGEPPAAAASPRIDPGFVTAARETLVEPIFGTGTIEADRTTVIGPRVSGVVDEIYVDVGDRVEADEPLFRTRPALFEVAVAESEATARLARIEAQKAHRDWERVTRLRDRGVASVERLDEIRTAFEMAEARRDQAVAALERARQNLDDTVVRAPYAGVITERYVDEGAMMSTALSSSAQVVELTKLDTVVAIVEIPDRDLPRVRAGMGARVAVDGTGETYETAVEVVNDRVDPVSRVFEVRLRIPNPERRIKPGLFARADLLPEPRPTVTLDRRALIRGPDALHVFVDRAGMAERRAVIVSDLDAVRVEVLEGLAGGERVLVGPNLSRLREGAPIAPEVADAHR